MSSSSLSISAYHNGQDFFSFKSLFAIFCYYLWTRDEDDVYAKKKKTAEVLSRWRRA